MTLWRYTVTLITIAVLAALLPACSAKEAPITVPPGAQAGDLVDLEPCTFTSENKEYAADCGTLDSQIVQWRVPLTVIQSVVGGLMVVAVIAWLRKREERGLAFGVAGFLLSLVALQLLYFYLSQFAAITATLLQLAFLQVLLAYRRWYLRNRTG